MRKIVYLCVPWDISNEELLAYMRFAFQKETIPIGPRIYFPWLESEKQADVLGISLIWRCDEVWQFGEGTTANMEKAVRCGQLLNLKVRYFRKSKKDGEICEYKC